MDEAIEEVIKNIIHIDKSAAELRDNIEKQISERKLHVGDEIERLRKEIVESKRDEIKRLGDSEINHARVEGENIIAAAEKANTEIYEKFLNEKDNLVKEIFNSIIKV